ncbi:hypothetical protein Tco_1076046 [Tanacetum coccineum]
MIADAIQQEHENLQAEITSQINNAITNHIPSQVDSSVRNYISSVVHPRDQDDPHDNTHLEGENSAKMKKTSEHGTYMFGESSSGQANKSKLSLSTSGNQEQLDDFYFWTNTYATDDDELPADKVSQEFENEMSKSVDGAKLHKVVDEMLRQRCTSGDEHQYHIDQMQNFLKNDIVWESRKEILTSPFPQKPILAKGNSGPEKIVLSLHKFPVVIFPDDDIEERTSRWMQNFLKNDIVWESRKEILVSPYPQKPTLVIQSTKGNLRTLESLLVSLHKFPAVIFHNDDIEEITSRWVDKYVKKVRSITEPDYKNLNKNDIEDMYLLIVNGKLGVESYQQKVNLTAPTITFLGIEKHKMFSIVSEPVYGIIYKNSKKEKRVMRHQEIHKFCDATLKRVLEGLKSYNNNVKHGYVTSSLSNEDVEYL